MFIEEPQLCKLIHFQGYPLNAQQYLVSGVPSMHICLSFIPELLRITNTTSRLFGINLLSHLAKQYSMPKTLDLCRLAIRIGLTLAQSLPESEICDFFCSSIEAFVRMASVFPSLSTMTIELLDTLKKISKYAEGLYNEDRVYFDKSKELQRVIDHGFHSMITAVKNDNKLISS